jgi:hypothetical protein
VELEKLRRIGEVLTGWHGIDLRLRRRFHIDAWIDLDRDGLCRLVPFG